MEPGDKMGFPPGIAESMVAGTFKKYQEFHQRMFPHKPELAGRWKKFEEEQQKK